MSVQEIEQAIRQLEGEELRQLIEWFETYQADLWDQQIEADALSGQLDVLATQARAATLNATCR